MLMELYHATFQDLEGTSGSKLEMTMTVLAKLCQAKYLGDRSLQSNQIKFSRHLQSAIFLKVKDEQMLTNAYCASNPQTQKSRIVNATEF